MNSPKLLTIMIISACIFMTACSWLVTGIGELRLIDRNGTIQIQKEQIRNLELINALLRKHLEKRIVLNGE